MQDGQVGRRAASLSGKHRQGGGGSTLGAESQHQPASLALVQRPHRLLFGAGNLGEGALGLHKIKALREVPGPWGRARQEGTQLSPP